MIALLAFALATTSTAPVATSTASFRRAEAELDARDAERDAEPPSDEDRDRWRWRAAAGAQIDSATHGVVDLGVARGPWSLQLFTDTLEARFELHSDAGRAWAAARGEFGAAGLFVSPWLQGAPAKNRSVLASYAGGEAGGVLHFAHGTWAGAELVVRRWIFGGREGTTVPVPPDRWVASPAIMAGWWRPSAEIFVRAALDRDGDVWSPRVQGEAKLHPDLELGPLAELRMGWSSDATEITRTRAGGLNPYVVPLAGAGWAEWWLERYVALRVGPKMKLPWGSVAFVLDGVRSERVHAWGVALLGRVELGAVFIDAHVGYAPAIDREEGVSRVSAWLLAGFDWHAL
ncbi:hypothetical protein L6R52_19105 [Myxococcota bacterium]|nr:hypothetical protein [Myxococcota bacterium]